MTKRNEDFWTDNLIHFCNVIQDGGLFIPSDGLSATFGKGQKQNQDQGEYVRPVSMTLFIRDDGPFKIPVIQLKEQRLSTMTRLRSRIYRMIGKALKLQQTKTKEEVSSTLFVHYMQIDHGDEEAADILVNDILPHCPYIKHLDWMPYEHSNGATQILLKSLPNTNLTNLQIRRMHDPQTMQALLTLMKDCNNKIKSLHLMETSWNHVHLLAEALGRLSTLQELTVDGRAQPFHSSQTTHSFEQEEEEDPVYHSVKSLFSHLGNMKNLTHLTVRLHPLITRRQHFADHLLPILYNTLKNKQKHLISLKQTIFVESNHTEILSKCQHYLRLNKHGRALVRTEVGLVPRLLARATRPDVIFGLLMENPLLLFQKPRSDT
mmetsp:Transcript_34538/g.53022  ORF Transcript_34538/g.53022 Transcript_34538/m.53022 type:complete len:377 (+) Transcript_34538:53-1183(+)